jgi:hypothetical protein
VAVGEEGHRNRAERLDQSDTLVAHLRSLAGLLPDHEQGDDEGNGSQRTGDEDDADAVEFHADGLGEMESSEL